MIRLNCFFQAKEGRYDEAIAAAKALVGESLTHPGCVAYDVFESATRPGIFMFCETWNDETSLAYHSSTDAFKNTSASSASAARRRWKSLSADAGNDQRNP